MRSFDDAEALYQQRKDPFYLAAFLIQCWLSGLLSHASTEYAEKKNPKDRSIQRGEAWRAFQQFFKAELPRSHEFQLSLLFRFSAADPSPRNLLRQALVPLSIEHHSTGDYFGPKTMQAMTPVSARVRSAGCLPCRSLGEGRSSPAGSAGVPPGVAVTHAAAKRYKTHPTNQIQDEKDLAPLCQRTIVRWCDWLDAAVHLRIHRHWHYAPACFDPDPETRWLAELGNAQLHLADLDPHGQLAWLENFAHAATRFRGSPKLAAMAKGMKSNPSWQYADVDTLVISLWPLVTRYRWTYRDLLHTITPALQRSLSQSSLCTPHSALHYPCGSEQEFATYCANVLGLRKQTKGRSAKNGRPQGYDIAVEYCPALAGRR